MSLEERHFSSLEEAAPVLAALDRPVDPERYGLAPGVEFRQEALPLAPDRFVNRYRVSWEPSRITARLHLLDGPEAPLHLARRLESLVTSTGGFFFLADRTPLRPRALGMNLAIRQGQVLSLPVASRPALVARGGLLSVQVVEARGTLSLGPSRLTWAGSLSGLSADCLAFGNANAVIQHHPDPRLGKVRLLEESSRFTPPLADPALVDAGFDWQDGHWNLTTVSGQGGLDCFPHVLVLRLPRRALSLGPLTLHTVGPLVLGDPALSGCSVGPLLPCPEPRGHPLEQDRYLGSTPLLVDRPSSRLLYHQSPDGLHHLTLFDGRAGSPRCPGVTLEQAQALLDSPVARGCFLDSGKTGKLVVRAPAALLSLGNRDYLRWPTPQAPDFLWVPDLGRPVPSLLSLHASESL